MSAAPTRAAAPRRLQRHNGLESRSSRDRVEGGDGGGGDRPATRERRAGYEQVDARRMVATMDAILIAIT